VLPPLPRVNGGINVQPLRRLDSPGALPAIEPELVELQLRAVYALGFEQARVSIPFERFGANFLAAIPYCRAARALGVDVVGVLTDFSGYALAQALLNQRSFAAVLNTYRDIFVLPEVLPAPGVARAGSFALQVMNEPVHLFGFTAEEYVSLFLRRVYNFFKLRSPELVVVSAAEVGNVDGLYRMRAMREAGLDDWCDRVAYHVYSDKLPPLLANLSQRPVWVTESGVDGTAKHLPWVREMFPEMRARIPGVERIFFYVLYDELAGRFRLFDIVRAGAVTSLRVESRELVEQLAARVAGAGAGPHARFEDLIPDVTAYFPTPFDLDRVLEASPFLPPT
jgi:hypothetical protein